MATFNIVTYVFQEILRIGPNLMAQYSTLQDQLLYLILIPHVILFLFILTLMGAVGTEHKGLRALVGISSYLFLIIGGWYGSFLVPLFIAWFYIFIILGLVIFAMSKVIHPARAGETFKVGQIFGGYLKKATTHGDKFKYDPVQRKKWEERLETVKKSIRDIEHRYGKNPSREVGLRLVQLQEERNELERVLYG